MLKKIQAQLDAELAGAMRVQQIHARLIGKASFSELASEILDAAVEVTEADFGTFQLAEGDVLRIVAYRGFGQEFLDFFREVNHQTVAVCGAAFAEGSRVIAEDVERDALFQGTEAQQVLLNAGVRAVQATPLFGQSGELYGMLATHFRNPQRPSERGLRYLDLVASQATSFIERMQYEELERQTQKLKAIASMASSVAHEINNPLQALTNILSLLEKDGTAQTDKRTLLKTAQEQLNRMSESLQKLLAVDSKGTSVRKPIEIARIEDKVSDKAAGT